ncbi:MAG TPA: NTP transferase domain-containing protein [Sphingomonadales bacterium]
MDASVQYPTLVLAGRRNANDPVAEERGVSHKALADVGGRPMIMNVLNALTRSPWSGDVYISIEDVSALEKIESLRQSIDIRHVRSSAGSICRSIREMVDEAGLRPPFLVVTADHALLTPEMLDHFWRAAKRALQDEGTDLALAMVSERAFRLVYPTAKRTFIRCREDRYSSCNMYAFLTEESLKVLDFWINIERERKTPWRLARAFGFGTLLGYLLRRYDLDGMIARAGRVVGIRAKAVKMPYPEAAIDVDTVNDLILAEDILARRVNA